jgi:cell division protease FtsH
MNNSRNIIIWIGVFIFLLTIFNLTQGDSFSASKKNIAFSDFISKVESKQINSVKISGRTIEGQSNDGSSFTTYGIEYPELLEKLYASGANIEIMPPDGKMNSLLSIFISWFPMLLFIGIWVFFMRQMGGGSGKAFGFGKSKAKLLSDKGPKVTFKDVAGIEEAKEELSEIVDFLRDPGKFHRLGGKIPKGCLLIGPPGTGKTMLAKAIAGEANVPFFSISGSDFVEMFVGVGASRVRDMFDQGKKNAPCIIFIDEIDAVGRHRGVGLGGGNDEREQTLNQLLVEMDGFEANEGVVIIAATNRPDVLDPALLRPGRFDRQITVNNPDLEGREKILGVHMRKIKYDDSKVDLKIIARGTPGFSGAELANLVNEAALLAARKGKRLVDLTDLEEAKDKVLMGVERRSMALSKEQKELTAYHEGGHAIVGLHIKASDPIHKATIIPRGRALGMVMRLPTEDRFSLKREKMEADIAVAMAGRVAEEMIFGYENVTSGASSDIKMATQMARAMVTEWGLSDKVGPIFHGSSEDVYAYGGRQTSSMRSEKTAETIDSEVKRLVDEGYKTARDILTQNIDQLHLLAKALIEHETLSGDQIKLVISGKPIDINIDKAKVKAKSDNKTEEESDTLGSSKKTVKRITKKPKE